MAKVNYDGVVEAVHLKPDGEIDWVRTYLRRGPAFSDYVLMSRQDLINNIKAGKKFYIGKRVRYMAATFEVTKPVKVTQKNGQDILVTEGATTDHDLLEGAPFL